MTLILDDVRTPEMLSYNESESVVVKNIDSLIDIFINKQQEFKILTLDHDLGSEDIKTGYDFLLFLEEAIAFDKITKIYPEIRIHSANPVGCKNMQKALQNINKMLEIKNGQK